MKIQEKGTENVNEKRLWTTKKVRDDENSMNAMPCSVTEEER